MKKVIICKGLPASGKSTFARQLVQEKKGMYKRINKDDLRAMLDAEEHSKSNEKFIVKTRDYLIIEALKHGKHVIIDDTNLAPKHEANIRQLVKEYCKETNQTVIVEVKMFDVPVEECIRRDLKRVKSVGERVIRQLHKDYFEVKTLEEKAQQDVSLPKAIICDLDGTLALLDRDPFNASTCEQDLLNEPIASIIKQYASKGHYIVLLSGRHDTYKPQTIKWLEKHAIPYDALLMRMASDYRKDAIVKREFFDTEIHNKYYVDFVLDDRNQVVDMWRKDLGLTCLQVNYGDF